MKLLIITSLYYPHNAGGAETSIKILAESLRARGHDVSVLATAEKKGLTQETINGVRVWRAGIRNVYWHFRREKQPKYKKVIWHLLDVFNPMMTKYAKTVLEQERPEIIQMHVASGWSSSLLRWATQQKLPTIQVLHGYYLVCTNAQTFKNGQTCQRQCLGCKVASYPYRHYSRKLLAAVGCSAFVLGKHVSFGTFEGVKRQRVILNARDPAKIGLLQARAPEGWRNLSQTAQSFGQPVVFGFMGRLSEEKGLSLLLETFQLHGPENAELWIAGTGAEPFVKSLQDQFKDSRIKFIGQSEPRTFFRQIDVAIIPSIWDDPLPGVTFEALAFGCAVIGSTRGGIPEMIEVGVNGFVFDIEKPAELAEAINRLAADPELLSKMQENAPESVAHFFSTDRFCSEYETLYNELLAEA